MNLSNIFFKERKYRELINYCMFIGYPRSGHTLYGALLDAHPDCVISHELNVLQLMINNSSRNQIFKAILDNSGEYAKSGRRNEGYKYEVKDQWQGKFNNLRVIGDKQGGRTSRMLAENPVLLDQFAGLVKTKIKILHVYRNPFDNLASRSKGGNLEKKEFNTNGLRKDIEKHFVQVAINDKIRKDGKFDVLDIKHENFLNSPIEGLKRITKFLELDSNENYLNACAAIVFKKPHKTRFDIEFPQELIDLIDIRKKDYDFLTGYSYKD